MATPSKTPQRSLTTSEINAWLLAAAEKHAAIHLKAARPWNGQHLHEAFTDMSVLFLEAFEEVRVVSESLREGSQAVRGKAADLRAHSTQLIARGKTVTEILAQFAPPPPEAVQQAESQMLAMFKGERPRGQESQGDL